MGIGGGGSRIRQHLEGLGATACRRPIAMSIVLPTNDGQESALRSIWGGELERAAFHALVCEGCRSGRLSPREVGVLLGLPDRWAVERWLADRGVPLAYGEAELASDRAVLDDELGRIG